METKNINLVLVTSVTHPFLPSVYSTEERFKQLTELTIPSIKKKIPNSYLVIIEGNQLTKKQKQILKNLNVDELLYFDVKSFNKSYGEATLLVKYFESHYFKRLLNSKNLITINKISGRYYLTEDYNFDVVDTDKVLIKKSDCSNWSKQGICDTRYYRFPLNCLDRFYKILKKLLVENSIYIDLEHSFYHYQIFEFDKIENVDRINLAGNLAPDGQIIFD